MMQINKVEKKISKNLNYEYKLMLWKLYYRKSAFEQINTTLSLYIHCSNLLGMNLFN